MPTAALIHMEGASKRFDAVEALRDLTLQVPAGCCYALLGPNGAGKTTTLNLLLGFLQADAGQVCINGVDVAREPDRARQSIAYIPEQVQLYPRLSGLENLEFFQGLSGLQADRQALRDCLLQAGLQEAAHDRPSHEYSKGMRQKVGIAIALARQAPVMLLDEPTSGLDPHAAWELHQKLGQLTDQGVAVLMATHDLLRAREVAHRIGILVAGQLQAELAAATLSGTDLEQAYLEAIGLPGKLAS